MALRPYWSGQIRLSLVSLPVNIFPVLNRSRQIALHEIYRPTGQRVHHQNVVDGEPVEKDDIVKGYEYEKGEYIVIEPEEINDLKIPSKKTLEIVQFISADKIDAIYYETPYFVAPDGAGAEDAYAVIREALRATGKMGVGQLAIGGHERLCAIQPYGNGILLETLRYKDEIRASDPYFADIHKSSIDKEQLSLAKELIKRKTTAFAPKKFHDHYREALQELIDSKLEHRKPREMTEEKSSGKVINLMDALRKSLKEKSATTATKKKPGKPAKEKKYKPATKPKPSGKSSTKRRRAS